MPLNDSGNDPKKLCTWLSNEETTCQAGDMSLIPGSGRSSAEGNGNSLKHILPGKSHGCQATVHGVAKESDMT